MFSQQRLAELLAGFSALRVGLLGDLFLDRYLELVPGVQEFSIETGLEAYQVHQVRNSPGALGTVMNNLAALGVGQLVPVTVIGDDGHSYDLLQAVGKLPADLQYVITDSERLTPTYTKPMRRDKQGEWGELNRIDVRTRAPLREATRQKLLEHLQDVVESVDGLIVLDQINEADWGVVSEPVRDALAGHAARNPRKLIYVDSRRHLGKFSRGILKGNRTEILNAAAVGGDTDERLGDALQRLTARTHAPVFCTAGDQGIWVAEPTGRAERVPGCAVDGPIDIVGAGDAATSGIVLSLLAGASLHEAAMVGNLVASITIRQLGTTGTATPQQVLQRWQEMGRPDANKPPS